MDSWIITYKDSTNTWKIQQSEGTITTYATREEAMTQALQLGYADVKMMIWKSEPFTSSHTWVNP